MINMKEIYQMQKDIEDLKLNGGGGGNLEDYYNKTEIDTMVSTELASKAEVQELFTSVSNGKKAIKGAIADKNGIVPGSSPVPTFDELIAGIYSIVLGDPDHKCIEEDRVKIYEILVSKLPSLESKITPDSSLTDYAFYINMIGELLFAFKDKVPEFNLERIIRKHELDKMKDSIAIKVLNEGKWVNREAVHNFKIARPDRRCSIEKFETRVKGLHEEEFIHYGHVSNYLSTNEYKLDYNKESLTVFNGVYVNELEKIVPASAGVIEGKGKLYEIPCDFSEWKKRNDMEVISNAI